jgi:xanthine dehydrogenase molybdopterin-binding subunit B
MGQGVHTKMCQVVATELNVPLSSVRVATNSTDMLGHTVSRLLLLSNLFLSLMLC